MADVTSEKREPGLCASCIFARVIENARGSRFYLCRLSEVDARFSRYPRLPVLRCEGWRAEGEDRNAT